jgi:hypothetical protein
MGMDLMSDYPIPPMEGDVLKQLAHSMKGEQDLMRNKLIIARSVIRAVEAAMYHEAQRCGVPYKRFASLKNEHARALKARLRIAQAEYDKLDREYKALLMPRLRGR